MGKNYRKPLNQEEYNKKIISDLQDFLIYTRTTSFNYGSRLLEPFVVTSCNDSESGMFVIFEDSPSNTRGPGLDHYWINKKDFNDFVNGNRRLGAALKIDKHYIDDGHIVFELRLTNNGLKNDIYDAQKLKYLTIQYNNGNLYKVFDVQVKCKRGILVENVVRLFVTEEESAEQFINQKIVFKDNMEATKGPGMSIVLSGPNTQEEFVRKHDALNAIKLEKNNTIKEVSLWFDSLINLGVDNAKELKVKFSEKFK